MCQWILTHPIMAETVSPQYDRALFYRGDVMYERLAVDVVHAADGSYNVFFLATGECGLVDLIKCYNIVDCCKTIRLPMPFTL